jgi:hypothetical protein
MLQQATLTRSTFRLLQQYQPVSACAHLHTQAKLHQPSKSANTTPQLHLAAPADDQDSASPAASPAASNIDRHDLKRLYDLAMTEKKLLAVSMALLVASSSATLVFPAGALKPTLYDCLLALMMACMQPLETSLT